MRTTVLQLAVVMAIAMVGAPPLRAQQPDTTPLTLAERSALAEVFLAITQMVPRYAMLPDNMPTALGPQQLLHEAERLRLTADQRRALEALDFRMEQMFFGVIAAMGQPDTTMLARLWGDAEINTADLAMAASRAWEREKRAVLEFVRIADEMLSLLTPEQRTDYLLLQEEAFTGWAQLEPRSAEEAARVLADMAETGMLPHPLLLGRLRAPELGLSPDEVQRLDSLHVELVAALRALRGGIRPDASLARLSATELQAAMDTLPPGDPHVLDFASELLRLRNESYRALSPSRAAALKELQAELALQPYRPRRVPPRECREGNLSGGRSFGDGLRLNYLLRLRAESADISLLVIGRGDGGRLRETAPPAAQERRLSGFSLGRWFIGHDEDAGRLWLHETPIDLGDANVAILDLDDVADGEPPRVVALLRIDAAVSTGGCVDAHLADIMRDFVHARPELQPYLRPHLQR